jgi:uncharacterized protein YecE (DUF72 family)
MARIGTSGWHYKHWRGPFYPGDLPAPQMLAHYLRFFETVELNNTFYRLPEPTAVQAWKAAVPPGFLFAAKGSRFLTHMKKLQATPESVDRFFSRVDLLGRKLGPVVFQLPPRWQVNVPRLSAFLEALPSGHRYAFELRDPSWHRDDVYQALRRHRAAFCIYELAGFASPHVLTTDFVYVRLHGPGPAAYQGTYSERALEAWARRIEDWEAAKKKVYVYFDNDQAGYAVRDALELRKLLVHSPVSI